MGQRGKGAVFMPKKFVFPGGAVDETDEGLALAEPLDARTRALLELEPVSSQVSPEALATAAIRELSEETGMVLAHPSAMRFFLRAITPPGRPRRFDARFFLAPIEAVAGGAKAEFRDSDELSHLHWARLRGLRDLDIANVTAMVLERLGQHLPSLETPERVPLVRNDRIEDRVVWLG
ncbi:MAG: NUDIX hydrolase [Boseongicola sp.]|nr:NUDIX hydrolase [Boseongicola sp.]NNL17129.1 NUDIX hydrolase [Boseongicola sp.]